ncbi:MAG: glycoside hydrolase family 127 protein [Candidatus Aminicenantes bacterium]
MKKAAFLLPAAVFIIAAGVSCQKAATGDYPVQPVAFTQVDIQDDFWAPRLETNRTVTIPYAFGMCEDTGRVKNFEIAGGLTEGDSFCTAYPFDDSDVFKIIEGASYSLQVHPDPELEKYVDDLIAKIAAAQEEDGYLYTARTMDSKEPVRWVEEERWTNLYLGHELYNAGHLYEAAAAHYLATGKLSLLDVAVKNADLAASVFGADKKRGVPGHQVIEIGLAKLYRITGDKKYLDLAKFFLDERGRSEHRELFGEYSQDHKPVVEQVEAVGHAVRAVYMYSGMADVAALTGDREYIRAIDRIWDNVVNKKMYLTGGIGATGSGEAFGDNYELPNATAYAETCAAIGNVFWNHRMFLLHGDAGYIDIMERILYNGALSGVSLGGDRFFYPNPLTSYGQHERSPWFTCACCPSNMTRFMPSIPGYVYAVRNGDLHVNLFIQGESAMEVQGGRVKLAQETRYPWDGKIILTVEPENSLNFDLCVRIPGWARHQPVPGDLYRFMKMEEKDMTLTVNGEDLKLEIENGYVRISRAWEPGDRVELNLPMPVRRVLSHDEVKANQGRVALQRGPIVYCAEWPDNQGVVRNIVLPDDADLKPEFKGDMFDGVQVVTGTAAALKEEPDGSVSESKQDFLAIPYYAWAHRGKGEMMVWLARIKEKARPKRLPGIASQSRVSVSGERDGSAANDQLEPENSSDHSIPRLHWWPEKGTIQWVQYDFDKPHRISQSSVYWFDDTGRGECRVPQSWRVLVKQGDSWQPVDNQTPYTNGKDRFNRVEFTPVRTSGIRLEIQLKEEYSAGILEWKVN